ncbi:hypothetical protein CBR_g19490 [Chara braunii]|uniref:Glycosyl transferase 48 domain-containing protein n=1 Tax=Chara braunii TaxID=69332 RepID=A0A388KY38_CHABU|nr:hypothetical protein CBR_g19490 [Chara braunii]|eukprot:GBG74977.1 hypothetical protein CBR_g19490 [Chara braunii]
MLPAPVRGMTYYHRALKAQAFLDTATDEMVEQGYRSAMSKEAASGESLTLPQYCEALADLKFVYVVTAQIFGAQKKGKADSPARAIYEEILKMMEQHSSLRIAYIDGEEKSPYSVLVKYDQGTKQDQEVYRIKLPGKVVLGEGKPENQNHAIIFTRGEAVQAIDMNQDNYLEEAMKMRNLLEEFDCKMDRHKPTILGLREHIFTSAVSSIAEFMCAQELAFVTIGQRVLARPLRVRMHYGHPDVFDRLFHITRGGMSKASKTINVSEDIYAGFNTTLRGGSVTHHEYIQVGKGRDVGLNQISMFEAKVSAGNSEQMLSRDVYRLGHMFDFFRMLSFYFNTVGFYISTLMIVLTVYLFLYGRIYMALSGIEEYLLGLGETFGENALLAVLNAQLLVQIGILSAIPMLAEFMLERGFFQAIFDFGKMFLHLSMVFFTFSMGTKSHYFGRTLIHGGAKYRATGRGFVVAHIRFAENFRLFARSHFIKGVEIIALLSIYMVWSPISKKSFMAYVFLMVSTWFLAFSWLFAPFIFNPSGFDWQKTVDDLDDYTKWLFRKGGIGVDGNQSWERWFEDEHEHIRGCLGRLVEIILALRFFIYQFGVVYALDVTKKHKKRSLSVNGMLGKRISEKLRTIFRVMQFLSVCGVIIALAVIINKTDLSSADVVMSLLAYACTGWGIVQIGVAMKPLTKKVRLWGTIRKMAWFYDATCGFIIFLPLAILAWFPFSSTIQSRLLFNQAFSRGLEISLILAGNRPNQ